MTILRERQRRSLKLLQGGVCCSDTEVGLDLVVEDKHESSTGSSDDVGEGSLEEGLGALVLENLVEAIDGTSVHDLTLASSRLHHESSSHGVEGIGDDTGGHGHELSESPHGEDVSLLDVFEEEDLTSIESSEVSSSVENDTDDGDDETSVKSHGAVGLEDLLEAVNETGELSLTTLLSLADVGSESGSGKVERVHEQEGGSSSSTTGGHVAHEELKGISLGVVWAEDLLVGILEGEVEGLSGEVSDDIGEVSSPERGEALLSVDSLEAINDTLVSVLLGDVL